MHRTALHLALDRNRRCQRPHEACRRPVISTRRLPRAFDLPLAARQHAGMGDGVILTPDISAQVLVRSKRARADR